MMTNPQKQLLCTFANNVTYNACIEDIKRRYDLVDKKIFVFVNEKKMSELYLTFNILKGIRPDKQPNTISIHRKKQTNTLYTLNAMNKLIADENNGTFDRNFQLNWGLYTDCLILTNDVGVKIVPLKLFSIVST
jgi:hypothetical protein